LALLKKEGFAFRQLVDIFDGGPTVHCALSNIQTVRSSQVAEVAVVEDDFDGGGADAASYLLSNCSMDFRCCTANAIVDGHRVTLPASVARDLQVSAGDNVRWSK
jgi:arginine N-succinyltransferase